MTLLEPCHLHAWGPHLLCHHELHLVLLLCHCNCSLALIRVHPEPAVLFCGDFWTCCPCSQHAAQVWSGTQLVCPLLGSYWEVFGIWTLAVLLMDSLELTAIQSQPFHWRLNLFGGDYWTCCPFACSAMTAGGLAASAESFEKPALSGGGELPWVLHACCATSFLRTLTGLVCVSLVLFWFLFMVKDLCRLQ